MVANASEMVVVVVVVVCVCVCVCVGIWGHVVNYPLP